MKKPAMLAAVLLLVLPALSTAQTLLGEYVRGEQDGILWTLTCDGSSACEIFGVGATGESFQDTAVFQFIDGESSEVSISTTPNSRCNECRREIPGRYSLTSWDQRIYLVQSPIRFCNEMNAGLEPRSTPYGKVFLRANDWTRSTDEKAPIGYGCRLPDSFSGEVYQVKGIGAMVRVNGNRNDLKNKMILYQVSPSCVRLRVDGNPEFSDENKILTITEAPDLAKVGGVVSARPCD